MALIQQMDPIYADFTQPANTVLRMREAIADGKLSRDGNAPQAVNIRVDGTRYTAQGQLKFSDVSVDPGTGQVTLRGEFPNPDGVLLPGMYVRVSFGDGKRPASHLRAATCHSARHRRHGARHDDLSRRDGRRTLGADRRHARQ